jgi:O-acetyl-ADP-ribose deacetylase (regulator of RNase III)
MKRLIKCADIVKVPADAMIYSTNMRLALTGGVGAALLREFGFAVQIALQSQSPASGQQQADVGDIFQMPVAAGPWKRLFHTIATDDLYCTKAPTVRSILHRCLQACVDATDVRTITCSALGCGYGDLDISDFLSIADEVCNEFDQQRLDSFTIVVLDREEHRVLSGAASKYNGTWQSV